ncbi:MAG: hypothetical protein KGI25_08325 [Thaumarchaeota archaeon]|nr:hypothetical protein [Nitrososphaerota archaeon]
METLLDIQHSLINEYKKGDKMNEQITNAMAEANQLPVPPATPISEDEAKKVFVQTVADVSSEDVSNRVN